MAIQTYTVPSDKEVMVIKRLSGGSTSVLVRKGSDSSVKLDDATVVEVQNFDTAVAAWTYAQSQVSDYAGNYLFGGLAEATVLTDSSPSPLAASYALGDAVTLDTGLTAKSGYTATYKWSKDGVFYNGTNVSSVSTNSLTADQCGEYLCEITVTGDSYGRVLTKEVKFIVTNTADLASPLTTSTAIGA